MSQGETHKERVEKLAAHAHNKQWSGWMSYLFSRGEVEGDEDGDEYLVIPPYYYERWKWQAETSYADLPEEMKQSDRDEAVGILEVLEMMPDEPGVDE